MRLRLQSLAVSKLELFFHDIPLGPEPVSFTNMGKASRWFQIGMSSLA
jgi:hypothetical protein